jgi:fumarate hydratase class II
VYKPLMLVTLMESLGLLADAMTSFGTHCVKGILPNAVTLKHNVEQSLMLVTALTPVLGYDRAAVAAKHAHAEAISLRQAVVDLGYLSAEEFDAALQLGALTRPAD